MAGGIRDMHLHRGIAIRCKTAQNLLIEQWRNKAGALRPRKCAHRVRLKLAKALDTHADQQSQRTVAAVIDGKQAGARCHVGGIVRAEERERGFDADMHRRLAPAVLLAGHAILLKARVCTQTTHDISPCEAYEQDQHKDQHYEFFAHIFTCLKTWPPRLSS